MQDHQHKTPLEKQKKCNKLFKIPVQVEVELLHRSAGQGLTQLMQDHQHKTRQEKQKKM